MEPERIPAIDRSAHLLYSGDLNAACPNSVIEALACGLPVVASNVSVVPALIRDCGEVVDVADAEHVAHAVLDLVRDPLRLKDLGKRAHARAANYSLEAWQAQIAGHLRAAWNMQLREYT